MLKMLTGREHYLITTSLPSSGTRLHSPSCALANICNGEAQGRVYQTLKIKYTLVCYLVCQSLRHTRIVREATAHGAYETVGSSCHPDLFSKCILF
jgi:hypothetical protein